MQLPLLGETITSSLSGDFVSMSLLGDFSSSSLLEEVITARGPDERSFLLSTNQGWRLVGGRIADRV